MPPSCQVQMLRIQVTTSPRHAPARTESFATSVTCMTDGGTAGAGGGRSLAENPYFQTFHRIRLNSTTGVLLLPVQYCVGFGVETWEGGCESAACSGDRASGWSNELGRHRTPSAGGNPLIKVVLPNCLCSGQGSHDQ